MSRIESFSNGAITIGGQKYTGDVLVLPDGTVQKRRTGLLKMDSHTLKKQEIEQLVEGRPDIIVIGTGNQCKLTVSFEAQRYIAEAKIEFIALASPEAVARLNQLVEAGQRVAALLHITC